MLKFVQGNLLEADVEAVVNTVNTVGVMGKGIALMFKEKYPDNYRAYAAACKRGEVRVGELFVSRSQDLMGPKWIINFPTKKHWRQPSRLEWIQEGLAKLREFICVKKIRSIAIPPLGSGNGGLEWNDVKPKITAELSELSDVEIIVYEPTKRYQNVVKRSGVEKLTPARALIAEMIRRYEILGFVCSILEVQKLAWMLTRVIARSRMHDPFKLSFNANRYGPFANELTHLLNALDGSYLHCDKRLADASPFDVLHFDWDRRDQLINYFNGVEGAPFLEIIRETDHLIDGFQSPLGMEALATVDWLLQRENAEATLSGIRTALVEWPAGLAAGARKNRVFSDKLLQECLDRLQQIAY